MTLGRRVVLTAFAVAVPVAILPYQATERLRERDARIAIERFAMSQLTDDVRARCENYPQWFLAGPRENQPTAQERNVPDADVFVKRPKNEPLPFEYFAYDTEFSPTSVAGPPFPRDYKNRLKAAPSTAITVPFETDEGTGVQTMRMTGWGGSCATLLFRLRPGPNQFRDRVILYLSLVGVVFAAALAAALPTARRVRKLSLAARESLRSDYAALAPVRAKDEIASLAFDFNEAGADVRRRAADVKEREFTLQRLITNATTDVAGPLGALTDRLGEIERDARLAPEVHEQLRAALNDTHALGAHLQNLAIGAALRMSSQSASGSDFDLVEIVRRVVQRHAAMARASQVVIAEHLPVGAVTISGDAALIEQAIANLVNNAIRHNRAGGRVDVTLERDAASQQFVLRVTDNGPGVAREHLTRLNGIARFRGDEGRSGRPNSLGLGLAVVREVGDRFGIKWEFKNITAGGFEAELRGAIRA